MYGHRPVGAALDEEVVPDLRRCPARAAGAAARRRRAAVEQARRVAARSSGASRSGGRQPVGDGRGALMPVPLPTVGAGRGRSARSAPPARRPSSPVAPGRTRLATPTTPVDAVEDGEDVGAVERLAERAVERRRAGRRGRASAARAAATTSRRRRGAGRPRARPRAARPGPSPAPRRRRAATVASRRASRKRRERGDLVDVGRARARPWPARRKARCSPEPPQAQPGGPAPIQAAAWVTPGIAEARSTRSSTETARPKARARVGASARRSRSSSWSAPPLVGPAPSHLLHAADAAEQAADRARLDLAGRAAADAVGAGDGAAAGRQPRALLAVAELDGLAAVGVEPRRRRPRPARRRRGSEPPPSCTPSTRDDQGGDEAARGVHVVGDRRVGEEEALAGLGRVAAAEHGAAPSSPCRTSARLRAGRRLRRGRPRRAVDEVDDETHGRLPSPVALSTVSWTAASRQASTSHTGAPPWLVWTATRRGTSCGAG